MAPLMRFNSTLLRRSPIIIITSTTSQARRPLTTSTPRLRPDTDDGAGAMPDDLAHRSATGTTGGGPPLDSSSDNAPPKPKVSNHSVPGVDRDAELTEEQKREVDEHNRDFEKKHDKGEPAPDDRVDKRFWLERQKG